ncbi:SET domain-containing protein 4 [Durusdinium trenchii]|uniref:SET domain-containing protein 4 n=1 Tax=Durusdinium trenchii TaxID=1381693 RepID=A0ABP0PR09_9DINO
MAAMDWDGWAHLELVRQVARADVDLSRRSKGRLEQRIPPELSIPVLAAVALYAREAKAPKEEELPAAVVPVACKEMAVQADAEEVSPEMPAPRSSEGSLDVEKGVDQDEDEDGSPMPVAEHRFLAVEPSELPTPEALKMAELRELFEEASNLYEWTPAKEEEAVKSQLLSDVQRLLETLEDAVLQTVVADAATNLARLNEQKQRATLGTVTLR